MSGQQVDPNRLVEAYNLETGQVASIPGAWIGDPVLGRVWAKTPAQAEYDGDLPDRPTGESTVKDIDAYVDATGVEVKSSATKDEKLAAIDAVFARHGAAQSVQAGMAPVEPPPVPEGAPLGIQPPPPEPAEPSAEPSVDPADDDPQGGDGTPSTDTPSTSGNPAGNTTQE